MSEPVVAVVVAAGLGLRYGGTKPKPTLRILGRAVVGIAVEGLAAGGCTHAVVVINGKLSKLYRTALQGTPIPVITTPGGETRQQSVQRGLDVVKNHPELSKAKIVLVHDAVRPLMPAYVIEGVIDAVRGGAVAVTPAVPVADSVREVSEDEQSNHAVDRSRLRAIQTPQGFDLAVLLESHEAMAERGLDFTDDVTCCERNGYPVTLVPGSKMGIKITEPADLSMARALWLTRASLGHHSGRRFWRPRHRGTNR
ncbi:2-C-methyl-D-erythritol 4-phosphate cytidylyltransferase [Tessaracoccus caeni]|uniref:2-C-methyl-D-erythritol 4-phosphate cytidylyltransferase n=1 Tax=Tessaracoccus caeni TaxID=3031239 RepID=UPI0023DC5C7B|nr:2-C-methyl-D-erythritol 4-phosphate cytidylyltransferase [Tessaracoccus caeni]MDF1489314.1 2-C-methyl-D-erythritol 4-phosphate cytidylyltransferase [Tessaracoccus caeni]